MENLRMVAFALSFAAFIHPLKTLGAEIANARFYCLSLQFSIIDNSFFFTSAFSGANGELASVDGLTAHTHFTLNPPAAPIPGSLSGEMLLDLPPFTDVNGNGLNDFFESAMAVSATSSGTYFVSSGTGGGTVSAVWQRAAGSVNGTCVFHLVDNVYGDLPDLSREFTLLEYTGAALYTPGTNVISGEVNLVQTGNATNAVKGPFQFVKNATNRFDLLILQSGTWTNDSNQMLLYTNMPYTANLFSRGSPWTTNYQGFVQLAIPGPPPPPGGGLPLGYFNWALSIDDTNDVNHNGIPDFSDDPTVALQPPALTLTWTASNVLLSVSGSIGSLVDLQQSLLFPATNWQTISSLILTNNPQVFSFPNSPAPEAFWRALAH